MQALAYFYKTKALITIVSGSSQALLWLSASYGRIPPKVIEIQTGSTRRSYFCKVTDPITVSYQFQTPMSLMSWNNCFFKLN